MWVETKEGKKVKGNLTNWNESGLFFVTEEDLPKTKNPVKIGVNFEEIIFEEVGDVVTRFCKGMGIRFNFKEDTHNFLGWQDFHKIIEGRGYRSKG